MIEAFFKPLKPGLVWRTVSLPYQDATPAIAYYISGFYNPIWPHSALGDRSPAQFERQAY